MFSLSKLGYLTRSQLQILHDLKSARNASRVLKDMAEFVHMKRHFEREGEAVYYLNQKGREITGCEKEYKWTEQVEHYLMRNDLYIHFGCPKDWNPEQKIKFQVRDQLRLTEKIITTDVVFTKDGKYYLVEVDRKQSMTENKKKIRQYAELQNAMRQKFGNPVIVFYTVSNLRKERLKQWCHEYGLNCIVLTKQDVILSAQ